ncbi:hypothetical protein [Streptomyces chryseus]|uniref:LysR substrate-binding domain-containing protein n=1 Tax=Streptomyces chryseus TaxID=68186 RepID=A0ABQ3DFL9_9ACTN|nr:hypothetical protein [Streptomyces chryseus]GHA88435.1 hypothetical protein GCM10010346_09100 [Streptomyces chryseus]
MLPWQRPAGTGRGEGDGQEGRREEDPAHPQGGAYARHFAQQARHGGAYGECAGEQETDARRAPPCRRDPGEYDGRPGEDARPSPWWSGRAAGPTRGCASSICSTYPYRAVLPAGHPLAAKRVLDLTGLADEPRVRGDGPGPCLDPVIEGCAAAGFSPHFVARNRSG